MARYAYYRRLSRLRQKIYRRSDEIEVIALPAGHGLDVFAADLAAALSAEDRKQVTRLCGELAGGICASLSAPPVRVRVLAKRPSDDWEELHGLYRPEDDGQPARITVWMRTAKRQQVVAFRTFLRTLLHELCHHLDYEYLRLAESFHTEGFYKRESSLFRQLVPAA
ncbi:MAG: hypothetical protein HKN81_11430 [Gammaproteobacteria bacterium]|nr:hypothetical protein [Gammaproteobacteria bacterium]